MTKRTVLLNPGPVTLSPRVRAALNDGDWCHREREFADLTKHNNQELVHVYEDMAAHYRAVTLTGSGTSAVEAMLATFAPDDRTTLVLANGVYGERMAAILAAHRKPHQVVSEAWESPLDAQALADCLEKSPEISHVATVHHETTTGRLNDMDAIGSVCAAMDRTMLLDAVSSFGAERIESSAWNLGALAATANKCLHGVPGLSFVLAKEDLWDSSKHEARSVYLDLHRYFASQHGDGFSPFTQSVQVAFALREALAELVEQGGWQTRRATYLERAETIHGALRDCGVRTLMPPKDFSSVLWTYLLPDGDDYTRLHDALKAEGFVIYAGQGRLSDSVFRIAHMGDIRAADLEQLTKIFHRVLDKGRS